MGNRQIDERRRLDQEAFEKAFFDSAGAVMGDSAVVQMSDERIIAKAAIDRILKATPHNHRLTPLYIIRLHIFRHYYRVNLLTLFSLPCASKAASNLGNLTKNLTARLTHNGCAVLP